MTEISPEHRLVIAIDKFTIFCAPVGKVSPVVAVEKGLAS
jgi:hypothetical protein